MRGGANTNTHFNDTTLWGSNWYFIVCRPLLPHSPLHLDVLLGKEGLSIKWDKANCMAILSQPFSHNPKLLWWEGEMKASRWWFLVNGFLHIHSAHILSNLSHRIQFYCLLTLGNPIFCAKPKTSKDHQSIYSFWAFNMIYRSFPPPRPPSPCSNSISRTSTSTRYAPIDMWK